MICIRCTVDGRKNYSEVLCRLLSALFLTIRLIVFNANLLHSSLQSVRTELLQQLQDIQGAPSVQMQQVPPPFKRVVKEDDGDEDPEGKEKKGSKKTNGNELYDKVD